MRRAICLFAVLLMPSLRPTAQEQKEKQEEEHEYAPIVASNLDYHDFSYKTLDGKPVSLREYLDGKRLVIVDYAAAWCKNTNYNGPVVKRLYDKYKDRGLGVVVVMEYSDPEEIRIHINRIGIDYPVVIETKSREEREKSTHYKYRSGVGDKRKWGTPFYVLIDSRDVVPPVPQLPVAVRVYTASGELIETEAERFIELHLAR